MEEFLEILRVLDPSLQMDDVEQTFIMVGASESLNEEQFWSWCVSMFGDFNEDEYVEQMQQLMGANTLRLSPDQAVDGNKHDAVTSCGAERREWSSRLFAL